MVTIAEIARLAGVSKATVSNVLNGKIEQVGEETRQRILRIMEEVGYFPHQAARALKSKRTRTIALLFPHMPLRLVSSSFFFPGFLTGVAEACEDFNYQLLVTTSWKDCDTDFHYESLLRSRSIDGLIVSDVFYDDPRFALLKRADIPFISIGKPEGETGKDICWVDHNQEEIAEKAVEYLITLHHRDIVFIGLSQKRVYTLQRLRGYRRALERTSLPYRENLVLCEEMWGEEAEKRIALFLQSLPRFTALFTIGQNLTLNAVKVVEKLGLRIPQEVSILGNMETDLEKFLGFRLSGVGVKPQVLGYETAKRLIDLIEGKAIEREKIIEAELVIGESCRLISDNECYL